MSGKKQFNVGDRVRSYGMFNEAIEVSCATVKEVKGDALYLRLDHGVDDDGNQQGPVNQWVHAKQCRRLKPKTASGKAEEK